MARVVARGFSAACLGIVVTATVLPVLLGPAAWRVAAEEPLPPESGPTVRARIDISVEPQEITVGDPLNVRLQVRLPPDVRLVTGPLGTRLGPFSVIAGNWQGPTQEGDETVWSWIGQVTAYRTGDQELPAITLRIESAGVERELRTEPEVVSVRSVLDLSEGEATEPADLKAPVPVPPDWTALRRALGLLLLLGALALATWWLQRRFAARLAAVEAPEDPFHRTPPHVWVYGELQRLLERRLPEQGDIDTFYAELARILKRYLGGRYRLELMEQTTEEVPGSLEQAGTPRDSVVAATSTLRACDRVKFARARPGPEEWKGVVEDVYRIVDRTKPVEDAEPPVTRGVA